MKIRLEVNVADRDGKPVSGAQISLLDPAGVISETRSARKITQKDSLEVQKAVWASYDAKKEGLKIQCKPPEGYKVVASEPASVLDADQNITLKDKDLNNPVTVTFVVAPLDDEKRKSALKKFFEKISEDVTDIRGCSLRNTFHDLKSQVSYHFNSDWCDDAETKIFIKRLESQFDQFHKECESVEEEFNWIEKDIDEIRKENYPDFIKHLRKKFAPDRSYEPRSETLQERMSNWAARIANLMVSYKGTYDLIQLEVSSQQLPRDFLNKVQLEAPFERYQFLQKPINSLSHKFAVGPAGTCLAGLAEKCDQAVHSLDKLYESLERYNHKAPAAAREITGGLGVILDELKSECRTIDNIISEYEAGQAAAGLVAVEERLHRLREDTLGLIGELREAVGLQKLLLSWDDQAEWLATAKQGLVNVWGEMTELVQEVHGCIDLVESGIGGLWSQYISRTSREFDSIVVSGDGIDSSAQAPLSDEILDVLRDIATFIPLKGDNGAGGGAGGGMDGSAATRRVANAIAAVVGRPVGGDPKAFRAVLAGTFPEDEQTGQIVREPVRTVVSLAVDQGQLAAGQGSLSHEVQLIANDALKVLKGLKSIGSDTDIERAEALTRIVEQELMALKEEAGRVDRPRLSRVQEIFQQLADPGGHLDQLRNELELNNQGDVLGNPDLVTRQEAQLIASMDLLDGYADSLRNTFNRFFATPAGQDPRDGSFSGRLSFVSLLFSVVASSVRNVEEAMDAVDFHQPERRTTFISDPVTGGLISVDGILSWINSVAVQEGPDLIARSGMIGLNRVLTLVNNRLRPLVAALLAISRGTVPAPHPSMRHSRVRNALQQLDGQLGQFTPIQPQAGPPGGGPFTQQVPLPLNRNGQMRRFMT